MSETKVPSIRSVGSASPEDILQDVKGILEVREGISGNPLDANVTYRDLVSLNLATDPTGEVRYVSRSGTTYMPIFPNGVDGDGYDPTTDLTPPPQATGLTASSSINFIYLSWNIPSYRNHAYAEVWRADSDNIGDAVKIGTTTNQFFTDNPAPNLIKFYWIRLVSQANIVGVYSDSVSGTAEVDPAVLVAAMQKSVSEELLTSELASKINRLDSSVDVIGSVQNALAVEKKTRETADGDLFAQYTVKIDQNGYISGYGLASQTVSGTPFSSFQVRADRFSIVNPAVNRVTVSSLTRSSTIATLNTVTAHGLKAFTAANGPTPETLADEFTLIGVVNDTNWNGSYRVLTAPSSTQITFTVPATLPSPATVNANTKIGKASIPFIVDGGQVFIEGAKIKDASITSAKIKDLVANKITAGYVNAAVGFNGASVYGASLYAGGTVTVTTDGAGNVTGFSVANPTVDISGGNAAFVAGNFTIKNSAGGSSVTPFQVSNNKVVIKDAFIDTVEANKITAGYINASIGVNAPKLYGGEIYGGGSVNISTDANGKVTGFSAVNPTIKITGGNAEFLANNFKIKHANDNNTTTIPFQVVNNTVELNNAVIGTASINTLKIAGEAVFIPRYNENTIPPILFTQQGTDVCSVIIEISGLNAGEKTRLIVIGFVNFMPVDGEGVSIGSVLRVGAATQANNVPFNPDTNSGNINTYYGVTLDSSGTFSGTQGSVQLPNGTYTIRIMTSVSTTGPGLSQKIAGINASLTVFTGKR